MNYIPIIISLLLVSCGHRVERINTQTQVPVPVEVEVDNILDRGLGFFDACEMYAKKKVDCQAAAEAYAQNLKEQSQ